MSGRIKVGVIGCGTIGSEIAKVCTRRRGFGMTLEALCDQDSEKARSLKALLRTKARVLKIEELIRVSDVVVEAASASASADILEKCIRRRKRCMIMSVGGILFRKDLLVKAQKAGVDVYLPSGAVCGIDGLKSSLAGRIDSVTLTTRKPAMGLAGAPYLTDRGIDLSGISEEEVVFEGNAEEAVRGFPKNINVSAVVSLAGIGAKRTTVRIVASPEISRNIHELVVEGEFGRITATTENVPSRSNPKTSALAAFSALSTLERINRSVHIGT